MQRRSFRPKPHQCPLCPQRFSSPGGVTRHVNRKHTLPVALQKLQVEELEAQHQAPSCSVVHEGPEDAQQPEGINRTVKPPTRTEHHPVIDGMSPLSPSWSAPSLTLVVSGTICDSEGYDFDERTASAPPGAEDSFTEGAFEPFFSATEFEIADFVYAKAELSATKIDEFAQLLAQRYPDQIPPFANHQELYALIDSIQDGDVPWDSFSVTFNGDLPTPAIPLPPWAHQEYEVWFRDPLRVMESQLANTNFKGKIDYAPKRVFRKEKRQYQDLLSGNWAWRQAVRFGVCNSFQKLIDYIQDILAADPKMHGAMFAPVVLGSDKTTVSVATGQNDFYPLYGSLGNVHNGLRRSHRNALALIGFLAIPKCENQYLDFFVNVSHQVTASREYSNDPTFRKFRRQLFHTSLKRILSTLKPYMVEPKVTLCPDGHFRRVVYGLGPYIADYPEQALLACVVQGWCPRYLSLLLTVLEMLIHFSKGVPPLPLIWTRAPSQKSTYTGLMSILTICAKRFRFENFGMTSE
jgi:Plavaka transposase